MAKKILIAAALLAGMLAGALPLRAQQHELNCFIADPDVEGKTNIREKPGGKVIFQVDGSDFYQLTVLVQPGSNWWKIKDPHLESFGEVVEIPYKEAWIHRSVLALGTDNSDGHFRKLRTEPSASAPKAGTIREFNAVVRPLEMSEDGKWVKVKYEETGLTGWIEVSWMRDEAFEPGDGFGFTCLPVYAVPEKEIPLLTAPGKGSQTLVLKKGKSYELTVATPKDGWWEVIADCVYSGEDCFELDEPSWISAMSVSMRIVNRDNPEAAVPLYSEADDQSSLAGRLKPGTEVHPLDATDGWPIWVKVTSGSLTGWVDYSCLSWEP